MPNNTDPAREEAISNALLLLNVAMTAEISEIPIQQLFEELYDAGAASIDRVQVVDDFQARLLERFTAMADKEWTFEIDSRAEAKLMLRAAITLEMDSVLAEMEVKGNEQGCLQSGER